MWLSRRRGAVAIFGPATANELLYAAAYEDDDCRRKQPESSPDAHHPVLCRCTATEVLGKPHNHAEQSAKNEDPSQEAQQLLFHSFPPSGDGLPQNLHPIRRSLADPAGPPTNANTEGLCQETMPPLRPVEVPTARRCPASRNWTKRPFPSSIAPRLPPTRGLAVEAGSAPVPGDARGACFRRNSATYQCFAIPGERER